MHLAVIFENIGGYHAARLKSAREACAARGWRFTAIQITNAQNEHPWGELEATGFEFVTVLPRRDPQGKLTAADLHASRRETALVLDRLAPDALAIPGWGFPYSRAALQWCRKRNATAVLMSESKWDDEPRKAWKEMLKRVLFVRRFHAGLVGATAHRDYLVRLGMCPARIFRGYDVVDNEYFRAKALVARTDPQAARARQSAIPAENYFLAVTRFIPRKNLPVLIRAFARYRACAAENGYGAATWDLVICGSGSEEARMRSLIRECGLDRAVHLPGFINYRDIGDWFGLAGAFIHPALQEQWGLVVNEAMAAGLPVIVSRSCGCYPDLVKPAGFGFDPLSVEELVALMLQVSDRGFDRARLGRDSEEQVRRFAPEHFAAGLLGSIDVVTRSQ